MSSLFRPVEKREETSEHYRRMMARDEWRVIAAQDTRMFLRLQKVEIPANKMYFINSCRYHFFHDIELATNTRVYLPLKHRILDNDVRMFVEGYPGSIEQAADMIKQRMQYTMCPVCHYCLTEAFYKSSTIVNEMPDINMHESIILN